MLLKLTKATAMRVLRGAAVDRRMLESTWRQRRLAILCFHGVSTADEHECFPTFFTTPQRFREKLELIRRLELTVLPLNEAVNRLATSTLPKRSVVITLDDGFHGAYSQGAPVLNEFGYPATVYMTTHYVLHDRPVFDNMCRYLLWKGSGRQLKWTDILPAPIILNRDTNPIVIRAIEDYANGRRLNSFDKDYLLGALAEKIGIDYQQLRRQRLFHLVNADEMRSWSNVTFELHTHRHRVSRNKEAFAELIDKNRRVLRRITGRESLHFAYPSGACLPEHPAWLREWGIRSAVTCVPGLATPESNPCLLPRIVDSTSLTLQQLENWLTGVAALLPTRSYLPDLSQVEPEQEAPRVRAVHA